jgi:hypothetical protein
MPDAPRGQAGRRLRARRRAVGDPRAAAVPDTLTAGARCRVEGGYCARAREWHATRYANSA